MTTPNGRSSSYAGWLSDRYAMFDVRWLGVFRIVFGVLLCVDLLRRWAVATDFYTNDGVLPNHFSLFRPLGRDVFSIYHAFSSLPQVNVAFAVTLAIFVTFTLGYRTRLFHALSLIGITSLNARNLLVENGGTVVVNLLCFWTLFLPLGRRLSLDALRESLALRREASGGQLNERPRLPERAHRHYSLACFALLLQWSIIYFFNVVHKTGEGWKDGSALHWFLYQDRIVTAFGIFVRENVPFEVLRLFTYATLGVEGLLSVILLIPVWQTWTRRLALLLAIGLHGSIAATSRLGPFSYAMTVFFLLPLGAADWRIASRMLCPSGEKLRLIYDADCGICFQLCRILARLDLGGRLSFVGNDQRDELPDDLDDELLDRTLVVIDGGGKRLVREQAVSAVLSALPVWGLGLGLPLRVPGLSWLGGLAYDAFAGRRHEISARLGYGRCGVAVVGERHDGSLEAREVSASTRLWPAVVRRPGLALREALALAATVMLLNQTALDNAWVRRRLQKLDIQVSQPAPMMAVVNTFRLLQGWRMFAPEPPYEDGRMVVDGRTADGRRIDPLTGQEPDFDPYTEVGWGHTQLWCDYHLKMYFSRYSAYRQHLKSYLKKWHERTGRPEDRLVAFDVWWVRDKSPPPGKTRGQPLEPAKLITYGRVTDSGAEPWIERAKAQTASK